MNSQRTTTRIRTTRPPAPPATAPAAPDLSKRASLLVLEFHSFGNTKQVPMANIDVKTPDGEVDTKVDKGRLSASKKLLKSKELRAINTLDGVIKKYIETVCVPFEARKRLGIHMVPYVILTQNEERLLAFAVERAQLVEVACQAYPSLCAAAPEDLNSQHNPADYPTLSEFRQRFGFSWYYPSYGVPGEMQGVSREIWEQEREKAAKRMEDATAEIQLVLRESMAELVKHMVSRLAEDKDGKPLTFHKTTISKLTEFLANFDFRNITDDAELQTLVTQARGLLEGVDVEQLKEPGALRTQVQTGIATIAAQLDGLVVRSGGRKFRFEEE